MIDRACRRLSLTEAQRLRARCGRSAARQPAALAMLLAVPLALPGCKVGPDYQRPEVETPSAYSQAAGARAMTTARPSLTAEADASEPCEPIDQESGVGAGALPESPLDADWWRTFNDPVLTDLIGRAVGGNHDLQLAEARIRQARAQRGVVSGEALPSVDAAGSYDRSRSSERVKRQGSGGGESDLYQFGFDASWELDVFGRIGRGVEAAEADIEAFEDARRDVLVTLVSEVARIYVELRGAQQLAAITRRNVENQSQTYTLTQARLTAGIGNQLDVADAGAQLATSRSLLPALEDSARQSVFRLGVLLGGYSGDLATELLAQPGPIPVAAGAERAEPVFGDPTTAPGAFEPASAAALGAVPAGLPSELLRRRPDIRRAERELAAQSARIGVAVADLYPRFSLTGSFGFQADQFAETFDGPARFWQFGPAVRWPIFQGGRIRANIEAQNAAAEAALARYGQTIVTAFGDVESALSRYRGELERRVSLAESVAANRESVRLSTALYRGGLAQFDRVLDAERRLLDSEIDLVSSDQNVAANLIAVYKALGGGWAIWERSASVEPAAVNPSEPAGNR